MVLHVNLSAPSLRRNHLTIRQLQPDLVRLRQDLKSQPVGYRQAAVESSVGITSAAISQVPTRTMISR